MKPPLRIAILECDTPIGKTKAKYGGYGNVFKALLEAGAEHLDQKDGGTKPELELTYYDVVDAQTYPRLEDVDAVLLTGSRTSPSHKPTHGAIASPSPCFSGRDTDGPVPIG